MHDTNVDFALHANITFYTIIIFKTYDINDENESKVWVILIFITFWYPNNTYSDYIIVRNSI